MADADDNSNSAWCMDFAAIQAEAARVLSTVEGGLWAGRFTADPAVVRVEPARFRTVRFRLPHGTCIDIEQPASQFLRAGALNTPGSIRSNAPYRARTFYTHANMRQVFEAFIGDLAADQRPERVAARAAAAADAARCGEGLAVLRNQLAQEYYSEAVDALVTRMRARGSAIASAYGVPLEEAVVAMQSGLSQRVRASPLWRG